MYDVLKVLHILSVVGWAGSSVASVLSKSAADRTRNESIVTHALRRIAGPDARLRQVSAGLMLVTGLLMAKFAGLPILRLQWLLHGLLAWAIAWALQNLVASGELKRLLGFASGVSGDDATCARNYRNASWRWATAWWLSVAALLWGVGAMVVKH